MSFKLHDSSTAPSGSKPLLEAVQKKFGFIPNLMKVFAESPVAMQAYLTVAEIFEKSTFTPVERQLVLLSVSYANKCEYCVAVHSVLAKGIPDTDKKWVDDLRQGKVLADPKLQALVNFTKSLVAERGFVNEGAIQAFVSTGYTNENILEIIAAIGLKTISNYTNHLAHTPLDEAFQSEKWAAK